MYVTRSLWTQFLPFFIAEDTYKMVFYSLSRIKINALSMNYTYLINTTIYFVMFIKMCIYLYVRDRDTTKAFTYLKGPNLNTRTTYT